MNTLKPYSLTQSLVLHLLPGLLGVIGYILIAPLLLQNGYPAILALIIAAGGVILPFQLGYLFLQHGKAQDHPVIALREPLPKWQYIALPLLLVIWGFLASGALAGLDLAIARAWFSWLPEWFLLFDVEQFKVFPREALLTTFWIGLLVNGLAGPIVEELYFRGHLLPRLPGPRNWLPLINLSLFSLYHFWAPWQFFSRIVWLLPWGYVTWRKQNMYLMLITHCVANILGWTLTWAMLLASTSS